MPFLQLGLSETVVRAVVDAGYTAPTPIQAEAIPAILAGNDLLGCAQTGTGKTASFTLPMIDILAIGRSRARMPRSLILEPTRELAAQVADNFDKYGKFHKLTKALLIGGMSMGNQERILARGVDVLIATPGRLLDHLEKGHILLSDVKILVIDEADRMLDMGFIPDVERIVARLTRTQRQTLLFSATMPPEIRKLADRFLTNPKEITVSPPASTNENVEQRFIVVEQNHKEEALKRLLAHETVLSAIIFCNRKHEVAKLQKTLLRAGHSVGMLHGNMSQSQRMTALDKFRKGEITLMVASDVAARGLDINDLSHVFNYDMPISPEDYVHRIGRTGRAGKAGYAYSLVRPDEAREVNAVQKLIGKDILQIAPPEMAQISLLPDDGRKRRGGRTGSRTAGGTSGRTGAAAGSGRTAQPRNGGGGANSGRRQPSATPRREAGNAIPDSVTALTTAGAGAGAGEMPQANSAPRARPASNQNPRRNPRENRENRDEIRQPPRRQESHSATAPASDRSERTRPQNQEQPERQPQRQPTTNSRPRESSNNDSRSNNSNSASGAESNRNANNIQLAGKANPQPQRRDKTNDNSGETVSYHTSQNQAGKARQRSSGNGNNSQPRGKPPFKDSGNVPAFLTRPTRSSPE